MDSILNKTAAVLIAGVAGIISTTSDPALAKVTIACKNAVQVGVHKIGSSQPQAKSKAQQIWSVAVVNKYGPYWSSFSKSKYRHYTCQRIKGGWTCGVSARPCGQAIRQSASSS